MKIGAGVCPKAFITLKIGAGVCPKAFITLKIGAGVCPKAFITLKIGFARLDQSVRHREESPVEAELDRPAR